VLANKTGNIAVINYIIKTLSTRELTQSALQYYTKTIHHLLLIYPYLLPIIDEYIFIPFKIDANTIKLIANDIYNDGLKFNRYESLSYALYYAIKYKFKLDKRLISEVRQQEDCVFMLLSYIYDKSDSKLKSKYQKIAKDIQSNNFLKDKFWLFIYEVLPKDDLSDPCLKALKGGNISFIKMI
jgi:hypothetical protein